MAKYSQKQEQLEDYTINYKKHVFSKNIKLTLKPEKTVLVTMPYYCSFSQAKDFLMQNFEKIKSFKIENKKIAADFKTKFDTLKIIESDKLKISTKNKIVYFEYPSSLDFNSEIIQKELKKAHLMALKIEAKYFLIDRIKFLASKYGFKINKIALKNQKTRFGSCSWNNNINLNINLLNYDFDIIDYVLIHELCHTRVKNHSQTFWDEVRKYCPNYKNLRKRLKE